MEAPLIHLRRARSTSRLCDPSIATTVLVRSVQCRQPQHNRQPASWRWQISPPANAVGSPAAQQEKTSATTNTAVDAGSASVPPPPAAPSLSVMPTPILLRTWMVTSFLSSGRLLDIGMPIMQRLSTTKLWLGNPDRNPALRAAVKLLFYDHFTAGGNEHAVRRTIGRFREIGYSGMILAFAKETVAEHVGSDANAAGKEEAALKSIEQWEEGNLQTIKMLGTDDILAVKFTGAGEMVVNAMLAGASPPFPFKHAFERILEAAIKNGNRVVIDAEQQCYQPTIDAWTINFMRKYCTQDKLTPNGPVLLTTIQAYLKSAPQTLLSYIKHARDEGWFLAMKIVRGAYIASETRSLIHDTKADTDNAYNALIRAVLVKELEGIEPGTFPPVRLIVAGHNAESVDKAQAIERDLIRAGKLTTGLEYGQIQGMSDELSCSLVQIRRSFQRLGEKQLALAPKTVKSSVWGSPQECMQYLVRRAIENRDAVDRAGQWRAGLTREVWRRVKGVLGLNH